MISLQQECVLKDQPKWIVIQDTAQEARLLVDRYSRVTSTVPKGQEPGSIQLPGEL